MERLRDSSEIKEAAALFAELVGAEAAGAAQRPSRAQRLATSLRMMCQRGGFGSAVVADRRGLPLAVHDTPLDDDALGAFVTVAADALTKTAGLADQWEANHVSFDVSYAERAVVHTFEAADQRYYLMLVCPVEANERGEVELTIEQLCSIIGES